MPDEGTCRRFCTLGEVLQEQVGMNQEQMQNILYYRMGRAWVKHGSSMGPWGQFQVGSPCGTGTAPYSARAKPRSLIRLHIRCPRQESFCHEDAPPSHLTNAPRGTCGSRFLVSGLGSTRMRPATPSSPQYRTLWSGWQYRVAHRQPWSNPGWAGVDGVQRPCR